MKFKFQGILLTSLCLFQCINQHSSYPNRHFISFDKIRIVYSDEGKGEAVMLIHGFIADGSMWENTVLKERLLDQGYRVITPDLRGNGDSDQPQNKEAYENNVEIEDLMALANHLKLRSYIAIGYSRGSILLAKLLTKDGRISKAVFGGMGIDFTEPNWSRKLAFADAFSGRAELSEMTEGAVNYAKSIDADLKILGWLQDYQPVTSIAELNTIEIKTLVICGDEDKDNGDPAALQQQLPNSQLAIVEGDHNGTYSQEDFAEAVMNFISD